MFIVLLTYLKPLDEVEVHLPAHIAFLDEQYKQEKFIFSGRKNPRTGGVIGANVQSREELDAILRQDPFYAHQVAEYEVIEFTPTKYDPKFAAFVAGL
ncbi:YciI family protein [Paenibacillus beijingensis]|uniref:GTP cyclohydrolase n=1 Tax=Paenibacillus beijingensis TaxID=1126833 RepID=A0A0D5NHY7_9BACL|nr:YciI family protein [Paenibacillus beijingensis]AJY74710.1 GTP cyclohydrolase [Paenibacillus beijingensis]